MFDTRQSFEDSSILESHLSTVVMMTMEGAAISH
jgi:hypothetical protein